MVPNLLWCVLSKEILKTVIDLWKQSYHSTLQSSQHRGWFHYCVSSLVHQVGGCSQVRWEPLGQSCCPWQWAGHTVEIYSLAPPETYNRINDWRHMETCLYAAYMAKRLENDNALHVVDVTSTYLICSGDPPDVAFVMAQAASFRVLNSALPRISINTGKMLASITFWNKDDLD